ncbi:heme peroxidase, partial [Xylaria telfairii]
KAIGYKYCCIPPSRIILPNHHSILSFFPPSVHKFEIIMHKVLYLTVLAVVFQLARAEPWPYNRYYGGNTPNLRLVPNQTRPEFRSNPPDLFIQWFRGLVNRNDTHQLGNIFRHGMIPDHVGSIEGLFDQVRLPDGPPNPIIGPPQFQLPSPSIPYSEAEHLFRNLNFPLDPRCTINKSSWWYRTYDGSCNWLQKDFISYGAVGTARTRDYDQHTYSDRISKPRDGPNARAVSNAFFKRKQKLFYNHTPVLLGLIEFVMHDITYSLDSATEKPIEVSMPDDELNFSLDKKLKVKRTAALSGTGTSPETPRENVNMATTWLDISSLYGSTPDVAKALRSYKNGKLLTQEVQAPGTSSKASYLPFNSKGGPEVPTNTRPGVSVEDLFAGGDPRTNEDWLLLAIHTLILREHNRLCDVLIGQKPDLSDEDIYQSVRLLMSAKYSLIANSYQMTYWTDEMPWPRDDGFPLYREMMGQSVLSINPANTYPWPLVTKGGRPMVASAEMAIVYRFHEFIIPTIPIKDAKNNTLWDQKLFDTGFNASGFIDVGLENILRGMANSNIPNFKSGIDESFRSAGVYRGEPFDIAVWSIVHEREQGLPTFNQYFRAYNEQDPMVSVPIRNSWEDFSSDAQMVANLQKLYKSPDDVDLVVGVQLDEEYFPGTTVPKSALIISLFSLFNMGNSDRFSIGFAMMRCLLVDKPWDCRPSNALEDLLWEPRNHLDYPNFRFYNEFWLNELDIPAHGTNLLWRLITENSEVKCVQRAPLVPADLVTNPILCQQEKPEHGLSWLIHYVLWLINYVSSLILTVIEIVLAIGKQGPLQVIVTILGGIVFLIRKCCGRNKPSQYPPVFRGWPIVGCALAFQKDSLEVLEEGFTKFENSVSRCFGIRLASLTHYVITNTRDLELIKEDNECELKFSLHLLLKAINFDIITKPENFESDIHTELIRTNFGNRDTVAQFSQAIEEGSQEFLRRKPLATSSTPSHHLSINEWLNEYIAFVMSRCVIGPDGYDNPHLIDAFLMFNNDAIGAMGLSSLLPKFLQFLATRKINKRFAAIQTATHDIIEERRKHLSKPKDQPVFLDYILTAVEDNSRASDLIAIVVWGGLVNLQTVFSSTLLDIINHQTEQSEVLGTLGSAKISNLDTFRPWEKPSPWNRLRGDMFESIRLSGPVTGPSRIALEEVPLASDKSLNLPKGSVAALSAYTTHRDKAIWGDSAAIYDPNRFVTEAPPEGEPKFVSWGLKGPHMCPGRWFGQTMVLIMTKTMLQTYTFEPDERLEDDRKYVYSSGTATRVPVSMKVALRE